MKHRILAVAAILATASAFAQPTAASVSAQAGEFYRTKGTTAVRNFPDRNGSSFQEVEAGAIVRAFSTSQGVPPFREVEVGVLDAGRQALEEFWLEVIAERVEVGHIERVQANVVGVRRQ